MKPTRVLLLLFCSVAVLRATSIIPMSVEELTTAADVVVEAKAVESWTQWNSQHTILFTHTRFQVLKTLKGAPPQQIVVKQPGGESGGYGQRVAGVRQFLTGESTALFLRPSAAGDGAYVVVGLVQGNFRMYQSRSGEMAVTNGVHGVSQLEGRSMRVYTGSAMTLKRLESRVQGAKQK